ncbi:MAG TPA: division/cell wall cluster transcriptional repressor MraZ [Stellaceae bacterium]|nr:division/cell wall cluster transcriptional repressor MraZ [Stellaceae bacterium]
MQERLETLEQFSDDYESLTQLFADSHPLSIDAEGRIVLPERLKDLANITDEIAFVGRGATFQLWNPGTYEEHSAAVRERSRRLGVTLPARGGAAPRPA